MALYLYGVTSSEIGSTYLSGHGGVDSTVLDQCIEDAASKLNAEVSNAEIDPSAITLADYPQDYAYIRSALMKGAAAMYLMATTGGNAAVADRLADYRDTVTTLRNRPNVLTIFTATNSDNIPISHTTKMGRSELRQRRARLDDPLHATQWETL